MFNKCNWGQQQRRRKGGGRVIHECQKRNQLICFRLYILYTMETIEEPTESGFMERKSNFLAVRSSQ